MLLSLDHLLLPYYKSPVLPIQCSVFPHASFHVIHFITSSRTRTRTRTWTLTSCTLIHHRRLIMNVGVMCRRRSSSAVAAASVTSQICSRKLQVFTGTLTANYVQIQVDLVASRYLYANGRDHLTCVLFADRSTLVALKLAHVVTVYSSGFHCVYVSK